MTRRKKFDQYKSVIAKSLENNEDDVVAVDAPTIPSVSAAIERTGAVKKSRSLLTVDVDTCKPWQYADRDQSELTDENCALLVDDIRKHGQQVPAIARKTEEGYEIISGRRRLFACSKTKDRKILLDVRHMSDKDAVRIMIMENENREDISEIERAINMYKQIKDKVWNSVDEMRSAYCDMDSKKYSQAAFYRILQAGRICEFPDVLDLFRPIGNLKIRPAREIISFLEKQDGEYISNKVSEIQSLLDSGMKNSVGEIYKALINSDHDIKSISSVVTKSLPGFNNAIEYKETDKHYSFKVDKSVFVGLGKDKVLNELAKLIEEK